MKQFYLACIVMDRESGNSRGFGYVTFADPAAAEAAKSGLQGCVSIYIIAILYFTSFAILKF